MINTFDIKSYSRERIRSRLLKKIADIWGIQESEIDALDPLIVMIMEACSVEFEKTAREINATQARLLNRLADLMNPDLLDITRPSYGILQAKASDYMTGMDTDAQFVFKKTSMGLGSGAGSANTDIFFSPVVPVYLHNASIVYIANNSTLFQVENGNQKKPLAYSDRHQFSTDRSLWVGMEIHPEVKSLAGFNFYFDWQNDPDRERLYQFLPLCKCYIGNAELKLKHGITTAIDEVHSQHLIEDEFNVSRKLENHVLGLFNRCYLSVQSNESFKELNYKPQTYPYAFDELFSWQELKTMKEELVWLRFQFPDSLPPESLNTVFGALNAFPVMNRRLQRLTYKLQQHLNIVPLHTDEAFLTVRDIRNAGNVPYKSTPLSSAQDMELETFTLRYQGVHRFDARDTAELLNYVLDMLRDESVAFAALGEDFLASMIRELNQNIARLEQQINMKSLNRSHIPYLMIKPKNPGENAYIEYWTTLGEVANRIPAGSRLNTYSSLPIAKNEIFMLTSTTGGKNKLSASEKIYSYKRSLLTRNRVVTLEDIKATCFAELGNKIQKVEVSKSFKIGATPQNGFMRCIQIKLYPAQPRSMSAEEWLRTCEELEMVLATSSAMSMPYQISVVE
jgi:hypothetical protein